MKAAETQESKFGPPTVDRFERHPLDWRVLADGEPPARDWALEHWLGMGHVTILAALGGLGKTLLAQMIGSALALGRPFIDSVPRTRNVLMWGAEDDHDELWRRECDIARFLGVGLEAFAKSFVLESFSDRDCTLMDLDLSGRLCWTPMLDELREQVADYGAEVVILDNSARLFGGKESDRNQVTRFVAELNGNVRGAAVLLVAHAGRAVGSEYSGSTAWENASRSRMFLSDRPPDAKIFDATEEAPGERRYLSRRKANYASRDLRAFHFENGVLVPETDAAASGLVGALLDRRYESIVLDGLRKLSTELGQQPTDASNSPAFLPRLICQFSLGEGGTQRDLSQAMRRLMVDGRLRREVVGRYGNRNPRFGLVAAQSECTR